ncbi:arginine deiminase family protein, partial [Enterococcus faecalis]|uniref:arginine deiminase family protein n=1 Tax=Enterococcus faecalis TaxID=1351 RepID=UPI003CC5F2F9
VFNIVAEKVCIAATEHLPYNFIQMLKRSNFKIIDVPSELVFKHGCNVQALGKGKVLGIENNKSVNEAMEAEGIKVI